MPLRGMYATTKHPVAYSTLTLVLGMLAIMGISTGASIQASENAADRATRAVLAQDALEERRMRAIEDARQREAARVQAENQERSRRTVCVLVSAQLDAYADPTTPTGVKAQRAWKSMGLLFKCTGKEEAPE